MSPRLLWSQEAPAAVPSHDARGPRAARRPLSPVLVVSCLVAIGCAPAHERGDYATPAPPGDPDGSTTPTPDGAPPAPGPDAGPGSDSGAPPPWDAGGPPDAGTTTDSGGAVDSGAPPSSDAGSPGDAGPPPDTGVDRPEAHLHEGALVAEARMALTHEIRRADCAASLVAAYPADDDALGCRDFMMWIRHDAPVTRASGGSAAEYWVDGSAVLCHFSNHLSLYPYRMGDLHYLDVKGLTGAQIATLPSASDHTERFGSCEDLAARVGVLAAQPALDFAPVPTRPFAAADGVTVVASASTCASLGATLDDFLEELNSEPRETSELYCVSDATVATKNPSTLRAALRARGVSTAGILLVGADLPIFEMYGPDYVPGGIARGQTDLPYGNLSSSFWDYAPSKTYPAFEAPPFFYRNDYPTPFAWDMSGFDAHATGYVQEHWVSRWLEGSTLSSDAALNFERFVAARRAYAPPAASNIDVVHGASMFYTPGDHTLAPIHWGMHTDMRALAPSGSRFRVYSQSTARGALAGQDRNATLVVLNDHGEPSSLGDLYTWTMGHYGWVPPVVHLDACYGGAWGLATDVTSALVSNVLNLPHPPVAVTGGQAIQAYPLVGNTINGIDVFLAYWRPGQTLGARQREALENNLGVWTADPSRVTADLIQIFSMHSVFGDATVEM